MNMLIYALCEKCNQLNNVVSSIFTLSTFMGSLDKELSESKVNLVAAEQDHRLICTLRACLRLGASPKSRHFIRTSGATRPRSQVASCCTSGKAFKAELQSSSTSLTSRRYKRCSCAKVAP